MLRRPDTETPPRPAPYHAHLAGQSAWVHGEEHDGGYIHTYDALKLPGHPAHKVHIVLPHGYGETDRRYPVLYMNDGQEVLYRSRLTGKSWDVRAVLNEGHRRGLMGELLVVAVEPINRDLEYTHTAWRPGAASGQLGRYIEYLADTLKPFFDANYRTLPAPATTRVCGSSHGGLAAFAAAALRPDAFGGAIAMSSSFFTGLDDRTHGIASSARLADSALMKWLGPTLRSGHPRLYLDWGLVREGGEHNGLIERLAAFRGREMARLLERDFGYSPGGDLQVVEDAQGEHDEISWGRRLGPALVTSFAQGA